MSRNRPGDSPPLYDNFDWRTMPFPDGACAVFCRPKCDENFNLEEFMREGGYPGEIRLPKGLLAVRKQAVPILMPSGEVVTSGEFRGYRDYLEYLGVPLEQEEHCRCRRVHYSTEDGYVDGLPLVRRNLRHNYGLAEYKNNYLAGMMDRRPSRVRSGMRHGAVASRSDSSTYPTSHISQHTAASHSSSSHHIGPVADMALNMFTPPNQQNWAETAQPTPISSGYVGVNSYDGPVGYRNVVGAVPTPVNCGMAQMMSPNVQVVDPQPVNQGNIQNADLGDVNEFFVTNVFQEREPTNSMHPGQVQPPAMSNYQNTAVFKTEDVDYGYDGGQMYQPVLTQQVYQPQHEPPVVRTAAGGECDGIIKFEEPSDYEQNTEEPGACAEYQYSASVAEDFSSFEGFHGMPMQQHGTVGRGVENIYAAADSTQPYPHPIQECANVETSEYSAQNSGSSADVTSVNGDYIKEETDSDGGSFFASASPWVDIAGRNFKLLSRGMPHIKFNSSDDEPVEKAKYHGDGSGDLSDQSHPKLKKNDPEAFDESWEKMDSSDFARKKHIEGRHDYSAASGSKEPKEKKKDKIEEDDGADCFEPVEKKKERSMLVDEKTDRKKDERRERQDERTDKNKSEDRRERPKMDDRQRNDDRREKSDDYRRKNYESDYQSKKPRRDDFEDKNMDRDRDRQGGRFDNRRRDDFRNRDRDERDRFQRKDDRRDYGGPRRDYRGGGGSGYRRGGQDRNGCRDREGGWRGRDDKREDRSTWDVRPSAEEVAKQKKLLWGSKATAAPSGEGSGLNAEVSAAEAAPTSTSLPKNVGLWSSAITASGVGGEQANKFLKLMGIKNAATVDTASADSKRLQEESEKQKKMLRDLDRQYEIARETTHMGRGLGLGFHQ